MKFIPFTIFILTMLLSNRAIALSSRVTEGWKNSDSTHLPFLKEPTFATFWGGIRRGFYWPNHKGKFENIYPKGFRSSLEIYFSKEEGNKDLYIIYPGVFGKADSFVIPQMIDAMEKLNSHVAVIPNLLASNYLLSVNHSLDNALIDEQEFQIKIFEELLLKIGAENISNIHILAESLGSFQILNALNHPNFPVKKIRSTTLLWPPLYLDRAITRFDNLIEQSLNIEKSCSFWLKWPQAFYDTYIKDIPETLSKNDRDCFGAWVISTNFVKSIKTNAEEYDYHLGIKSDQMPDRFKKFINRFLPGMAKHVDQKDVRLSLTHLLASSKIDTNMVRIISSKDDFLNSPEEWNVLFESHHQLKANTFLFEWGGHSGPIGMENFLESLYF